MEVVSKKPFPGAAASPCPWSRRHCHTCPDGEIHRRKRHSLGVRGRLDGLGASLSHRVYFSVAWE